MMYIFKVPAVRWLVPSCLLANIGAGMVLLTMTWSVVNIHNSVTAVAGLMFCFWLPAVIFSPIIGSVVDTYRRKSIVILTKIMRIIILFFAAWIYYQKPHIIVLYVLAAGMGTCAALYTPACMAMVRETISSDNDLLLANIAVDMAFEVGFIIGMPLSGFIMVYFSPSITLILTAICFFFSLLCTLQIKPTCLRHSTARKLTGGFWQDSVNGLRYLVKNQPALLLYGIQLLIYVILMTTSILLAPFAKQVLMASSSEFGAIEATLSLGSVTGALLFPKLVARLGDGRSILLATLAMMMGFIFFALCFEVRQAMVLYFIIGMCLAAWPVVTTSAQHLTEQAFQGRIQTMVNALSGVVILLVYFAVGSTSAMVTIRWSYLSVIFVCASASLLTLYSFFIKGLVEPRYS